MDLFFVHDKYEDKIVEDFCNYLPDNIEDDHYLDNLAELGFFKYFFKVVKDNYDVSLFTFTIYDWIDVEYCLDKLDDYAINNPESRQEIYNSMEYIKKLIKDNEVDYSIIFENIDGNMVSDAYNPDELLDYLSRHNFNKTQIKTIQDIFEEYPLLLTNYVGEFGNPDTLPQYYTEDMFTVDLYSIDKYDYEPIELAYSVKNFKTMYNDFKEMKKNKQI